MFVVVAAPHGSGTSPNQIASPTMTSVAVDVGVIVSASARLSPSYSHDSDGRMTISVATGVGSRTSTRAVSKAGPPLMLKSRLVVVREDRVVAVAAEEGVDPRPADQRVVLAAAGEHVVAGAAVEDVVRLLPAKLVVAGAAVDRVGIGAAAQERLVALTAGEDDRAEEVEPGARFAAAVEVVVAAEQVHVEPEGAR